jgi:hypothetical protein
MTPLWLWGSEGIAPLILNRNTRWRPVLSFMPTVLYHQTISPCMYWLGGPQSWSGHTGREKNVPSLLGIEPWFLSWSACILVTIPAHSLICMYETFSFQYQFCVVIQQPGTSNTAQTQIKTESTGNINKAVELRTYHTYWQGDCTPHDCAPHYSLI